MIKRLWAWVLTLVMVLSMSTVVLADETATVYIAGTAYTSSEGLPEGVSIDWDDKKITLNGTDIDWTVTDETENGTISLGNDSYFYENWYLETITAGIAVLGGEDWVLTLTGENNLRVISEEVTNWWGTPVFGIFADGNLKMDGSGSLTVTADNTKNQNNNSSAVIAKDIVISGCTLNATAGNETKNNTWATILNAGTLTITDNAVVTATNKSEYGVAIGHYSLGGEVEILSGTVTATSNGESAIASYEDITISGGTVAAIANDKFGWCINSAADVVISGGTVTATSEGESSRGINGETVSITDSADVTVDVGDTGIRANGSGENNNAVTIVSTGEVKIENDVAAVSISGNNAVATISTGSYEGRVSAAANNTKIAVSGNAEITGDIINTGNGQIEVSGGSVSGDITTGKNSSLTISNGFVGGTITAGEGTTATVSGGEFAEPVNPDYLDESINVELESDGTYTYHESVDAALEEAESGDEIALVGDAATNGAEVNGTTVVLPEDGKMTVGEEGSVSLPAGTRVTEGEEEKTLENGGTLDQDGAVEETVPTPEPTPSTSSSRKSSKKYDVEVEDTEDGTVKVSSTRVKKGATVTITVTPDEGYELDELVVLDSDGDEVEVKDKGNGKYTFVMPRGGVEVEASFEEAEEVDEPAAEEPAVDKTEEKEIILTIGSKIISIDGEYIVNDVAPIIRGERTVLPIRVVAEALGAAVEWDEAAQTVTIVKGDTTIVLYIDQSFALVNGEPVQLDAPAFIENDRTYLPLRFVMEQLGAEVIWDETVQTVTIIG